MQKRQDDGLSRFLITLGTSLVIGAIGVGATAIVKVERIDQRESDHYEDILELKQDIKDIKGYLIEIKKKSF